MWGRIVSAPCGAQGQHPARPGGFYVGGLVGRGDLDYAAAFMGLLAAARSMPAYRDPWHSLEERVAHSLEAGIVRPLAISETELWMRRFHARLRLRRPATSMGARHG